MSDLKHYIPTIYTLQADPTHKDVQLLSALLKLVDDGMSDDYKKSLVRQIQMAADLLELKHKEIKDSKGDILE